jgi:hypothetical protein
MTYPRLRLAVAVLLFVGWLGFLAYLVTRTRDAVILSRPQLLETELIVVAEVKEKDGKPLPDVTVKETLWSGVKEKAATTLHLAALPETTSALGWRGAGDYILPLVKTENGYDIASLPRSPGYIPKLQVELGGLGKDEAKVLSWLREHTSVSEEEAKKASPKAPVIVQRNLDYADADKLKQKLEAFGALVLPLHIGVYRIYRATSDARAQVREIKGSNQNP